MIPFLSFMQASETLTPTVNLSITPLQMKPSLVNFGRIQVEDVGTVYSEDAHTDSSNQAGEWLFLSELIG